MLEVIFEKRKVRSEPHVSLNGYLFAQRMVAISSTSAEKDAIS